MKAVLVVVLGLFSVSGHADCKTEAVNLLDALQAEALTDLTSAQQQQARIVIEQLCAQRIAIEEAEKPDNFTELFLSGEGGDKPGNKRLKRLSR